MRVLLVEDAEVMRELMAEILGRAGYHVDPTADALVALQLAEVEQWDAAVIDLELPDMRGADLYSRICQGGGMHPLPVVFLTIGRGALRHPELTGCNWVRFLEKPFTVSQLLSAVEQSLGLAASAKHPPPKASTPARAPAGLSPIAAQHGWAPAVRRLRF